MAAGGVRDESERGRALSVELFRVERYVELVLSYLRLQSPVAATFHR